MKYMFDIGVKLALQLVIATGRKYGVMLYWTTDGCPTWKAVDVWQEWNLSDVREYKNIC